MRIVLKNEYTDNKLIFENKSEMINYINYYLYNIDYSENYLNKINNSKNKNKYSVNELINLFSDYIIIKGKKEN